MHCIAVRWTIAPGEEERVRELALSMVAPSNAEPGCRCYMVHADPVDPGALFLYEQYDDAAAFQAHCDSPHFKAVVEAQIFPRLAEARLEEVATDTPVRTAGAAVTVIRWRAEPGAEDLARTSARRISDAIAGDPACLVHAVHDDPADPAVTLVYAQYDDRAAFERHIASAYFSEIVEEGIARRLLERRREHYTVLA